VIHPHLDDCGCWTWPSIKKESGDYGLKWGNPHNICWFILKKKPKEGLSRRLETKPRNVEQIEGSQNHIKY